ncbi:MAG TPA: transcription elongation factor GreA [Bryobacteraceae bacterium]|nr:transcription elongation factor GreA [Bryobacteraceae bacterium]HPT28408.1 transcription elongation factor GreA [Bryobacteraceae bacterium]
MDELKKKLQDEITVLEYELRNELPKEILKARAHGDLRENAEFHAAKERQRYVDSRLSSLKKRLADLSLVNMDRIPHDCVGLGSSVLVLDVEKDEEVRYKIVASEESDAAHFMISTSSPIGRSLLGKKVGDEVTVTIPGGTRRFEVLELATIHDLAE